MYIFPIDFERVQDGKIFLMMAGSYDDNKRTIESGDGERDVVTWVSDEFFVSGQTGHTFKPYV